MRKTIVVFSTSVILGLAMIGLYSSCGDTDSEDVQSRRSVRSILQPVLFRRDLLDADYRERSHRGRRDRHWVPDWLVDASGSPIAGQQICFAFENPGVATITEPTNACGLTDANGNISGQFRSGSNTGSFALVATAPAGFNLRSSRTISFVSPGSPVPAGGGGCNSAADCPAGSQCSASPECGAGPCCLGVNNDPCTSNAQCSSPFVCSNGSCINPLPTSTPAVAPTPTALPAGSACTTNTECGGLRCSSAFPGCVTDGCCTRAAGSSCLVGAECNSNSCVAGSCT